MRFVSVVLAGVATLAMAGNAGIAANTDSHSKLAVHEITVRLPGGGVEHIRYAGNIKPDVTVTVGPAVRISERADPFWTDPGFAELDRISAEMDRFWTSLDSRMSDAIAADQDLLARLTDPNKPLFASFEKMPAGSYSFVSQFTTNGACAQTIRVTQGPGEAKPQIVSQTSGDCGKSEGRTVPADSQSPTSISTHSESVGPDKQTL